VARLIQLRHDNPVLRCRHFLHGKDELAPEVLDIAWFDANGDLIENEAWNNPEERLLAVRRASQNSDGSVLILTVFLNPTGEEQRFRLPPPNLPTSVLLDSAEPDKPEYEITGEDVVVAARSVVLTKAVYQIKPS
jgi:glycogen operon protein